MLVSERLLYQCVISIHENTGLEESRLDNEEVKKKKTSLGLRGSTVMRLR